MRARSASAPSVRSRANQRALSIDSASRLDRLSIRSRCSRAVRVGHDVFERDQARRARPGRAAPCRGRCGRAPRTRLRRARVHEPVFDDHRVRARERALERLREVVVAHVRREPHAFGELDRPHRLRVVADEHDERAEPERANAAACARRVDDLAQVERRRAASARGRAATRAARWRWPSRRPGRSRRPGGSRCR